MGPALRGWKVLQGHLQGQGSAGSWGGGSLGLGGGYTLWGQEGLCPSCVLQPGLRLVARWGNSVKIH